MITDIAWSITQWYSGGNPIFLIVHYILLILVWTLGILLNRKKGSRLVWGILLAIGVFSLVVSGSYVYMLFFGIGGGFGGLGVAVNGFLSCCAFIIFLHMINKTISLAKHQSSEENSEKG